MMTGSNNSSQQAEFELCWLLNTFFPKAETVIGFIAADVTAVRNASRNLGIKQSLLLAGLHERDAFVLSHHSLILQDVISISAAIGAWLFYHCSFCEEWKLWLNTLGCHTEKSLRIPRSSAAQTHTQVFAWKTLIIGPFTPKNLWGNLIFPLRKQIVQVSQPALRDKDLLALNWRHFTSGQV